MLKLANGAPAPPTDQPHLSQILSDHNKPRIDGKLDVDAVLFSAHPDDSAVLSELCATLSHLAVRNEFCQDIVDLGGLAFIISLLADGLDCQVSCWRLSVRASSLLNTHKRLAVVRRMSCRSL